MQTEFAIVDRIVGSSHPCFIIAEAGVNHNGDLRLAMDLIDIAADAGADAVKFQTFIADRLVTRDAPKAAYQAETTGDGESQYEMLRRLELSAQDHRALIERCRERGILFLSTPFDEQAADLLDSLGVGAFKTPSGELTNLPYLRHIAAKGKPMIVSTGMATLGEVEEAVDAISQNGCHQVALLHCVSSYPADPAAINLRAMATLKQAFSVPVGYSDHTSGLEIAFASVALGAAVIEKHFTIDRGMPGPDHRASLEPDELAGLVRGIRAVELALGNGRKYPTISEADTAQVARKSLVLARDISSGEAIAKDDIVIMRPGTGIAPKYREQVIGRSARYAMTAGTVLTWNALA